MNPPTLLAVLVSLGVGFGGVLWGFNAADTAAWETEEGGSYEEYSRLGEEVERLREENTSLKQTVESLQKSIAAGAMVDGSNDGVTPDSIATNVFDIRERSPVEDYSYQTVSWDEIESLLEGDLEKLYPPAVQPKIEEGIRAVGFVGEEAEFSFLPAVLGLRRSQEGTYFDAGRRVLMYPDNAPLENPQERGKFVEALVRALARDHAPGYYPPAAFLTADGDRHLALRSLPIGDATQVKIRYNLIDQFAGDVPPPSPESREQFYGAPIYLRERALFPYFYGARFVAALQQDGGWSRVDAAYSRPPQSTAEIMHPELYLASPPFTPEPVILGTPEVTGLRPVWSDVAGEYGILLLFKQSGPESRAEVAAEGWKGDRYLVYPEDAFVWKTAWTSPAHASEFFMEMRQFLLYRYGQKFSPDFVRDREFLMDVPGRFVQMRYSADGASVVVLSAREKRFVEEMELALLGKLQ